MDLSKIVSIIHNVMYILINNYGFIFSKNTLIDKLYIITYFGTPLSWLFFKDECWISYLLNKYENPNYVLGSNTDSKDIIAFYGNKQRYYIFFNINHFLRWFSFIIINNRTTNISYNFVIPTFLLYSLYNYDITYNINYRKVVYPYFQIILAFHLIYTIFQTIKL